MPNYVLVYEGGSMPESEEAGQAVTAAWGTWYADLGEALVDGGSPFGPSTSIASDGSVSQGAPSGLTANTVISADDLMAATERAKGCPILDSGGKVDMYETFQIVYLTVDRADRRWFAGLRSEACAG